VVNADATGETQLTFDGTSLDPTWAPDGSRIAFAYGVPDDFVIVVMNADGSGKVKLTDNVADVDPAWSPDGSKIAFARNPIRGVFDNEIFIMNSDGTGIVQLTDSLLGRRWLPSWSPDGSQIAFRNDAGAAGEAWIMASDGTGLRFLTTGQPGSWSPDSRYVLVSDFGVGQEGLRDIFRVDVDTGARENLTNHPALDKWPVWRR